MNCWLRFSATIVLICLTCSHGLGQISSKSEEIDIINYRPNNTIRFITFKPKFRPKEEQLQEKLQSILMPQPNSSTFQLVKKTNDKLGYTHYTFAQKINGIEVEYSMVKVHCKNGFVESINGEYYPSTKILSDIIVDQREVEIIALKFLCEKGATIENCLAKLETLVYLPVGNDSLVLAYKIDARTLDYRNHHFLYVSTDGKLLREITRIQEIETNPTVPTHYYGQQAITTDSINSSLSLLQESSTRSIVTRDVDLPYPFAPVSDASNTWQTSANSNGVHYGAERTWDYFLNEHGYLSFDGLGDTLFSLVFENTGYSNANWGSLGMIFGDGDNVDNGPFTTIEIIGHEFSHGVTQSTANLVYFNESGALNESFSDIFGIAVDFYAHPATANFQLGDSVRLDGSSLRDLADPYVTNQPKTYQGNFWQFTISDNGGIHTNSQVQNYWYYLLCEGGSGENDFNQAFQVQSIGMDAASQIAFRTLTTYLTPNSNFQDARTFSIQSAIDLFGACSFEVVQVAKAWNAVGVIGDLPGAVIANFSFEDYISCTLPLSIEFLNQSTGASNYSWSFGDGNTSALTAPIHNYVSSNNYTVQLIASNPLSCNLADTVICSNCIIAQNSPNTPIPAVCTPETEQVFYVNYGITGFSFITISNSSFPLTEGYQDFTCSQATIAIAGSSYPISVETYSFDPNPQSVFLYIDYNNDGAFTELERSFISTYKLENHEGIVTIPTDAVLNTPLRMRVISTGSNLPNIIDTCFVLYDGQAEDYTITIVPPSAAPVADFIMSNSLIGVGATVFFQDLSANGPDTWTWNLDNGIPETSNTPNFYATFNTNGIFPITLTVSNSFGSSSITKYIEVSVNHFRMCDVTNAVVNYSEGFIYDSGGASGDYPDNQNCTFTISPGTCTDSIQLIFEEFQTDATAFAPDYLRIYDGPDTSALWIYEGIGNGIPPVLTAYSGAITLHFVSNSFATKAGFKAQWIAYQQPTPAPVANFSFAPLNPSVMDTMYFTDQSSANAQSWLWDFGDGTNSLEQNPSHVYTFPGTYTVTMIAQSCNGATSISQVVQTAALPQAVYSPQVFNFNMSCNETIETQLIIENQGGGNLLWNTDVPITNGNEILVWNYGVDTVEELSYTKNAIIDTYPFFNFTHSYALTNHLLKEDLKGKNILLIPEQELGFPSITLACSEAIKEFVELGGTAIICGDGIGTVLNTGLFESSSFTPIYFDTALMVNSSTPLTNGVYSTLYSTDENFRHTFTSPDLIPVFKSYDLTNDLVSYRNYGAGKAIYIGYDFAFSSPFSQVLANAANWGYSQPPVEANIIFESTNGAILSSSVDTINITINSAGLNAGMNNLYQIIQTNNVLNPVDTIWFNIYLDPIPCPNFEFETSNVCSGLFTFSDITTNDPISWEWDFGDGFTSNQQNPTHIFTSPGSYNVNLIVSNASGVDSIQQIVTVFGNSGPIPTSCIMNTNASMGHGLINFSLGTINQNSSWDDEGYMDFTCTASTQLIQGNSYNLVAMGSGVAVQFFSVYIDFNSDGAYSGSEILIDNQYANNLLYNGNIFIPTNNVVLNTPLRLRIIASMAPHNLCTAINWGQAEDYTVVITPNLSVNATANCPGQFDFETSLQPSYSFATWNFGDGTSVSTTDETVTHSYANSGSYIVEVIADGPNGADTVTLNINATTWTSSMSNSGNLYIDSVVTFNANSSIAVTNYLWDFGDGSATSTLSNPSHIYDTPGTYIVTLTISNSEGCEEITVDTLFIQDAMSVVANTLQHSILVYPNPFIDKIIVDFNELEVNEFMEIQLRNDQGQVVYTKKYSKKSDFKSPIEIPLRVADGHYTLVVNLDDQRSIFSLVKID